MEDYKFSQSMFWIYGIKLEKQKKKQYILLAKMGRRPITIFQGFSLSSASQSLSCEKKWKITYTDYRNLDNRQASLCFWIYPSVELQSWFKK